MWIFLGVRRCRRGYPRLSFGAFCRQPWCWQCTFFGFWVKAKVASLAYPGIGDKIAGVGQLGSCANAMVSTVVLCPQLCRENSQASPLPSVAAARVSQRASPTLPVDVHMPGPDMVSVRVVLLFTRAAGVRGKFPLVVLLANVAVPWLVHPMCLLCL